MTDTKSQSPEKEVAVPLAEESQEIMTWEMAFTDLVGRACSTKKQFTNFWIKRLQKK